MGRRSDSKRAQERFGNPPQQQVQIDVGELDNVICEKCNNVFFQPVFMMKKVSSLISPNGKEGLIPVQGPYVCVACGNINKEFLPRGMAEHGEETVEESPSSIITTDLNG